MRLTNLKTLQIIKNGKINKRQYMRLLKFGAEWCAPCRTMEERLKDFTSCEVKHYDVDSDDKETLDLIEKFKIRSVPTMILVDENGEVLHTWLGSIAISQIIDEINSHK